MGPVLTMLALLVCRASHTHPASQDMGPMLTILSLLAFPLHLLESQASKRSTKSWMLCPLGTMHSNCLQVFVYNITSWTCFFPSSMVHSKPLTRLVATSMSATQ